MQCISSWNLSWNPAISRFIYLFSFTQTTCIISDSRAFIIALVLKEHVIHHIAIMWYCESGYNVQNYTEVWNNAQRVRETVDRRKEKGLLADNT